MTFSVLALDYDGTIAQDGALDPAVRSAIAELRQLDVPDLEPATVYQVPKP